MAGENLSTTDIDLDNTEFQAAWKLIRFTRRSVFLTGKAGTGKSTFLRYICANTDKNYVVLAPTGIAAVNAGGVTLHSFFHIPLKPLLPDDPEFDLRRLKKRMRYDSDLIHTIRNLDLIIIDEISMVRVDVIDFIDKVLRVYCDNMREPFGGKQMLFVGDLFQLPPVADREVKSILSRWYSDIFFFNALVFRSISVVPVELTKVYRQTDRAFISMLDRIRIGRPSSGDISFLNSRLVLDDDEINQDGDRLIMTLATRRNMVDAINDEHMERLTTPAVTYRGEVNGIFPADHLPNDMELVLKVGAQVVFVKNDPERKWVNGTLGRVYMAAADRLVIEREDGERLLVEPVRWANIEYTYNEETRKVQENELGSFTQYPVKAAWALTIHKSQGLTFNDVLIDIGAGAFTPGQAYVALSRARSPEGLHLLSTISERDIFTNPFVVDFSRRFNDDTLINEALESAHADDSYSKALFQVRQGDFSGAFDWFIDALRCRSELDNDLFMRFARRQLVAIGSEADACRRRIDELEALVAHQRVMLRDLAMEYVAMADEGRCEGMAPEPVIANYDKALSIDATITEAWMGKAIMMDNLHRTDDACECLISLLDIEPRHYQAIVMLGDIAMQGGDPVVALEHYLTALDIDSEDADLHDRMSRLYSHVGDKVSASRHKSLSRQLKSRRRRNKN